MPQRAPVFDRIIKDYLQQVSNLRDRSGLSAALGIIADQKSFTIPLFNQSITITDDTIIDATGTAPSHATGVLACKYLLLCPEHPPTDHQLVTYKDFQDAAPYVIGFKNTAERPIATAFSGRVEALEAACQALAGQPFATEVSCQLAYRFQALPQVPIFLLFHDADDEFPAQCTLLFQKNAAGYLDMECLAMLGGILAHRLQ